MTAVVRGDALHIPLRDKSVNLIVTSPPYFALRSYRDACQACFGTGDARWDAAFDAARMAWIVLTNRLEEGEPWPPAPSFDRSIKVDCPVCHGSGEGHYSGQIGSEPTPQAFLEALWAVTKECWRVLADDGVMFVNLGDKRSGSGGAPQTVFGKNVSHVGPKNYAGQSKATRMGRPKSKMALPHRYFIGCMDGLADPDGIGWVARQDIVWSKPNGLPESVTDRVRDSHEYWFMLTKQERYFAAVDEVREAHHRPDVNGKLQRGHERRTDAGANNGFGWSTDTVRDYNPLGKLPGSVWTIPSEPLVVPEWLGVDHFAAFPQEWPRRLILGWSPSGICTACGEGRRPVVAKEKINGTPRSTGVGRSDTYDQNERGFNAPGDTRASVDATITGYACACPTPNAPTRPAVVLDPFGGTGTTAMVARALGRTGVSLDLSADYCRLAQWRIFESGHAAKARERTNRENQGSLL